MKRKLSIVLVFIIVTGLLSFANVFALPPIKVQLDRSDMKFGHDLFTKNRTVMVPVRDFAEALGAKVDWDNKTKTAWVIKDKMSIELTVGKDVAYIHRQDDFTGIPEKCELDAPVTTVRGVTYVPIRFVAERLGFEVGWENPTRTVIVKSRSEQLPEERPISFKTLSFEDIKDNDKLTVWYNENYQKKGIHYSHDGTTVYVLASAGMKPTGGYTAGISSVTLVDKHTACVSAFVTAPAPDMMVTQALTFPHVLIKLDEPAVNKVEGEILEVSGDGEKKLLPYDVLTSDDIKDSKELSEWYQSVYKAKGIFHKSTEKGLYIAVNAGEKNTGGYSVELDEVALLNNTEVFVTARVNGPEPDAIVTMAITYPGILIRVNAPDVTDVTGEVKDFGAPKTFRDAVSELTPKAVKSMELINLEGARLKDYKVEEMDIILQNLNSSVIDDSPHIEMIAGNRVLITLSDTSTITLWSYGSKTNFIAAGKIGDNNFSYHLVGPEIAKILLASK